MRPKTFDIDVPDVDADGIAEAQTTAGAANLNLNGVLADKGTPGQFNIGDDYSSGIGGVRVGIASTGDISGVTFTITGKDQDGVAATEDITGVNASTVTSTTYWSEITQIAADGAVGTNVTVGTVDEVVTRTHPLNYLRDEAGTYAITGLSGTLEYDVDETFDPIWDDEGGADITNWLTIEGGKSADQVSLGTLHARAVRLKLNSYSSGAELQFTVLQN